MNRRSALYTLLAVILTTIAIGIFSLGQGNLFSKQYHSLWIQAESINGKVITSEEIKGRQTILVFFNTQCEHCLSEIQLLKKYLKQISMFYQVLFISFESKADLSAFFLKKKVDLDFDNVHVISDIKMSLLDFYDIKGYPSFLIFNKDGVLLHRGEAIDENVLQKLLNNNGSE